MATTTATHAITADSATNAAHATTADTVGLAKEALKVAGVEAGCPPGTLIFHGTCYDAALNGACLVFLGSGIAPNFAATDTYYANTMQSQYRTLTIDGAGKIEEQAIDTPMKYICKYPLLH